jgi:tRNA(Ile)-lysidine synthetase-like protein
MKKVLAVSGGIDSVVMLHMFREDPDVVVAHFNHGIRPNSADDADFVERLAKSYKKPCFIKHAKLGVDCSEETARKARYDYLKQLAKEQRGQIYTAHHRDDLVETVAINFLRGTGWRGLAPLNSPDIVRPLLDMAKSDIYRYATEHGLRFRQDQTNTEDTYLRNRVRVKLQELPTADKAKLAELALRQRQLAVEIDQELGALNLGPNYPRELFTSDDFVVAEILRYYLARNGVQLTRPQLNRALTAIRTLQPGKMHSLDKSHFLKINKYYFSIISV